MSNFNDEDIARYREQHRNETFQVEPIETISFDENGHENGTWNGFAVSKIDDPVNYCYECRDKMNADKLSEYLNSITFLDEPVINNLSEWSRCITDLSLKEKELIALKEEKSLKEFEIIFINKDINFKELYGSTSEKVRKQHADKELKPLKDQINNLESNIDWLKRRISFLRQLVHTRTVLMEVKS
jgi:hypothetical protein